MNYTHLEDLLSDLYALRREEIKLGLEHTIKLLDVCDNPQNYFDSIHIAGTNGKGSTGKMIASIFRQSGYMTGHYTSPHLVKFNERININNRNIPDSYIIDFMAKYQAKISEINATYFEVITAMAFSYFKDNDIDLAIIETGLGGRLDSTNIIKPNIVVFTPISLDHREILGDSLEKISIEKAGIIKKEAPVISSMQTNKAKKVLEQASIIKDVNIKFINPKLITHVELFETGTHYCYKGQKYFIPIVGDFQAENAVLAIEAALLYNPNLAMLKIKRGLAKSYWLGRLQKINSKPTIYYDVSHNKQGIEKILSNLKKIHLGKISGIIALKGDKDLDLICNTLRGQFKSLSFVSDKNGLLMNELDLYNKMESFGIHGTAFQSFDIAIKKCVAELKGDEIGLIFGSHYLASEVFDYFHFPFD